MQTIIGASLLDFMRAFELNYKQCAKVQRGCSTPDEIRLGLSTAFWADRAKDHIERFRPFFAAEWEEARLTVRLIVQDNNAVGGYILHDGELKAFHNVTEGRGWWMFQHALEDGCKTLDCFEDNKAMRRLVEAAGFALGRLEPNRAGHGPGVCYYVRQNS